MTAATLSPDSQTSNSTRYVVLLGAIIVQLILGTVYGYSIFWQPLNSTVFPTVMTTTEHTEALTANPELDKQKDIIVVGDEMAKVTQQAVQQGYLKYVFAICILSFAVVMVLAGRVQDIMGPRFTAIIGAVLMGVGFMIAGLMRSPIIFYLAHAAFTGAAALVMLMMYHAIFGKADMEKMPALKYVPSALIVAAVTAGLLLGNTYVGKIGEWDKIFLLWGTVGFLAGAGIGFAYVCPIAALIKWFPNQKGLVSGLAVAGFGFGAFLFKGDTYGALGYIRSHGIIPFFLVHGLVCLVGITIGAMMLRNPPDVAPAKSSDVKSTDSVWQDTLRRPAFYVLWLMFFSGAMAGLMVIGIVKDFAGQQLIDAAEAEGAVLSGAVRGDWLVRGAAAVGWLAIFNAVGRVAWGFVSDWIGRSAALVAMFVFQAIMMYLLAGMNTEVSLAVAASVVGFNFGGNFALFPSATADLFGAKNLGANYGWVFTSYGIAGVVGVAAGNTAKVMTGSYHDAFLLASALCLLSAILAIGLRYMSGKKSPA
ncbi:MAG: MFS transporter [Planctomycetes bacterium]|nr:MFS transporter [Planctomycetota bacterium]NOG55509.1 MFS transporter [Planctomycetota bacterium]